MDSFLIAVLLSNFQSNAYFSGTVFLWVFWPSFNGILAVDDARLRCYINTYLSLCSSTVATFVISGLLGNKKFCPEDIQNATLGKGTQTF